MEFRLTDELLEIKKAMREFCDKEFTDEVWRGLCEKEEFPWGLYRKLAKLGFVGLTVPERYGGQGLGCMANTIVTEEMCRANPDLGFTFAVADVGVECIVRHGTEEQREKYVPRIARGEGLSAFATTEPSGGSDISKRLETVAVKEGDEWVISGSKALITNADECDYVLVLCQTDLKVEPPYRGQTLFIIERNSPGIEVKKMKGKLALHTSSTCEVFFDGVRAPEESVLGGPGKLNRGFYQTLDFLNESRVEIAANGLGIAQGAFEHALKYAKERRLFGKPLIELQAVAHKIAEMATKIEAARLLTYKAAWLIDEGKPDPAVTSMAKYYAARTGVEVVDEASQIFGGYYFFSEYPIERYYRAAKIVEIYEGTKEVQKDTIAHMYRKLKI